MATSPATSSEEESPNKSAKKPLKPLDTAPPNEMVIDGKRNQEDVKSQLKLKNSSKSKVAYKVMCNHPFVITIDKEIGFIEPGASATVEIKRGKFDADKYDQQGRRTYLLLQHVSVSPAANNAKKIWASVIGDVAMKRRIQVKLTGEGDRLLGESIKDDEPSTAD